MKYFLMHFPIILHNGLQKTVSQMYFVLEGRVGMGQGPITSWPEARVFFWRALALHFEKDPGSIKVQA